MGVVNITPDSFSDGGEWFEPEDGVQHGLDLLAEGADVLDVGGESTRPGSARVTEAEELRRVLPVISRLAAAGAVVSVDTTRATVAERAVAAGARIVNDVSGGLADPRMGHVVADAGVTYVAMHWRGHADVMDSLEVYDDVVAEVRDELAARLDALVAVGVAPEQVVLDPGLGFSKAGALNWPLLAHLDALHALGRPVLVGASRKRFLGHLLTGAHSLADDEPAPPLARDDATAALSALSAAAGAWAVRVHAVRASADAVHVAAAWTAARDDRNDAVVLAAAAGPEAGTMIGGPTAVDREGTP
ncbi:dihydropteroate synthase [Isoptericola sp. NEAU-Y5]|uniref:dihydropteroate synthase n=2 Tax=Isoptericola luteus TaxID=2879484 RepID=A0ABS7ZGX7_9MICO|nr:dihydropteroate synthase [Isoptericola sp. NEAU-Y5]MCA5893075.1 dihydropteroate synthase [Isoptericola sp. NEAU-Y5]